MVLDKEKQEKELFVDTTVIVEGLDEEGEEYVTIIYVHEWLVYTGLWPSHVPKVSRGRREGGCI